MKKINYITDISVRGVYFIIAPNQNKVKIGRSNDVKKRYSNLKTGFMDDGILSVIIVEENEKELESDIHSYFSRERMNLEWFFVSSRLREFLSDIILNSSIDTKIINHPENILKSGNYSDKSIYSYLQGLRYSIIKFGGVFVLVLFGILVGYYQYTTSVFGYNSWPKWIFSWVCIITYVSAAPLIWYMILEKGPLFLLKFYVLLIGIYISVEIFSFLDIVNMSLIWGIRIVLLVIFQRFTQIVSMKIARDYERDKEIVDAELLVANYKDEYAENYLVEIQKYICNAERRSVLYNDQFYLGMFALSILSVVTTMCYWVYNYDNNSSLVLLLTLMSSFIFLIISNGARVFHKKIKRLFHHPIILGLPIVLPLLLLLYLITIKNRTELYTGYFIIFLLFLSLHMIIFAATVMRCKRNERIIWHLKIQLEKKIRPTR